MSEYIFELDNLNLVYEPMKREEIVRCRDCKRFHPERLIYNCEFKHPREENVYQWRYTEPDGYCSFGERKKL